MLSLLNKRGKSTGDTAADGAGERAAAACTRCRHLMHDAASNLLRVHMRVPTMVNMIPSAFVRAESTIRKSDPLLLSEEHPDMSKP